MNKFAEDLNIVEMIQQALHEVDETLIFCMTNKSGYATDSSTISELKHAKVTYSKN